MAKRATLNDIATEVSLSVSMVSRVINGKPCRISDESRTRILAAADKLHYIPNQIARGLVSRRSLTLGLILPNIESRQFTKLTNELERNCGEHGYGLFITNSGNTSAGDMHNARLLEARGVDGIFLVPSNESYDRPEVAACLAELNIPYLLAARTLKSAKCPEVIFDSELGGYLATKVLLDNGHRSIGCIANTEASHTGRARVAGYERALAEVGIAFRRELVINSPYTMAGGYTAGKKLLRTGVTAVFAGSDYIALGARKAFAEAGLTAPRDYSIITFDRSESDFLFEPPMTAIEQDMRELGSRAFFIMLGLLGEDEAGEQRIVLQPRLMPGESVAAI